LIVVLGLARTAAADMVPEDPYTDLPREIGPTVAPDLSIVPPTLELESELDWRWLAGVGGVLVIASWMRRRRVTGIDRETRKTQFHMRAIDPAVAQLHATAWEKGPTIVPTAIEPAMIAPRRRRFAEGTGPQTPVVTTAPTPLPVATAPIPKHAPYPLTFPAYLAPAAATSLPSIEASGLHKWTPPPRAARDPAHERDFVINFARGSQPAERLEQLRRTIVPTLPADAETRITDDAPRPSDTLVMFAVRPRQR
jgi:hypothetical protein